MNKIKKIGAALALTGFLLTGGLAGIGYAQARATTTTGVVTIRQIISGSLSFASGSNIAFSGGSTLVNDGTNTVALRNGTNAQLFRIYNTYANGGTDFERTNLSWVGNEFFVQTTNGGTGSGRNLIIKSAGNLQLLSNAGSTTGWVISSGHLLAQTDNTYDIGASGATRPRTGYFGTDVRAGAHVYSPNFTLTSGTEIVSSADGSIRFDNSGGTTFGLMQLGGTTSSFPAIKRSGTEVQCRLADDSGYAPCTGSVLTATTRVQLSANGILVMSATAPTISSGFGSSPSIASNNGTAAFTINVGTGGVATSGVIGLPTASTGWVVTCVDQTTPGVNVTKQTANSTTSATVTNYNSTLGTAAAWAASDVLYCQATAF